MSASTDTTVWEWTPTVAGETARKLQLVVIAGALVDTAVVAAAVLTQSRFMIVLAAIITSIGVMWFMEHRRLTSTRCSIDTGGTLTMADSRSTVTADLIAADKVEIRKRGSGGGHVSATSRWSIEVVGPAGAAHHNLANVGGVFNLPEDEIRLLEAELQGHLIGGVSSSQPPGGVGATAESVHHSQPAVTRPPGLTANQPGERFEWQPVVSPNAARNRRLLWLCLGLPALAIVVYAVFAYSDDGVATVLISAATVPGMLLLAACGLDGAMRHGQSFRVVAEHGQLHVGRPGKENSVQLTGSTVAIQLRNETTHTGTGTRVHGTRWDLDVTTSTGEQRQFPFPSFGTATLRDDYIALERKLQQRT